MASNRHLGRIIVLQSLYEYEFRANAGDKTADIRAIVAKDIEPYAKALGDTEFVYQLAEGIAGRFQELDEVLQPMAPEWPLSTIAAVDRNVLRMGLFELSNASSAVPPKVAINEAVELAKEFGSDNSSKFVNGVLGTAYRAIYGDDKAKAQPATKSTAAEAPASEPAEATKLTETAEPTETAAPIAPAEATETPTSEPQPNPTEEHHVKKEAETEDA